MLDAGGELAGTLVPVNGVVQCRLAPGVGCVQAATSRGDEMEWGAAGTVVGQLGDRAAGSDRFATNIGGGRAGPEIGIAEVAANLPGVERGRFVRVNRSGATSCERCCDY